MRLVLGDRSWPLWYVRISASPDPRVTLSTSTPEDFVRSLVRSHTREVKEDNKPFVGYRWLVHWRQVFDRPTVSGRALAVDRNVGTSSNHRKDDILRWTTISVSQRVRRDEQTLYKPLLTSIGDCLNNSINNLREGGQKIGRVDLGLKKISGARKRSYPTSTLYGYVGRVRILIRKR